MKIHIGTSGYSYREWKGGFYPEKISPRGDAAFLLERLGAVEINNTFYHMPTESVLASWEEQVPDDFIFALKAPQMITHWKRLKHVDEELAYLFRTLSVLKEKLGPVLFQFPESFHADLPRLKEFLVLIPAHISCAFEFRSSSWFNEGSSDILRKRGYSLCMADTDENRAGEIVSTAPWGYLRLRRSDYTDADLVQWLERIRSQPWKRAFVFFKHEDKARGAEMAVRFQGLSQSG